MNKQNIKPDLYQKILEEKHVMEVELPSEGKFYSKDNILSDGKLNIVEMTGKHENILLSQKYIRKGTQYDELLRQLVIEKFKGFEPEDLILEDKLYLILAIRIMNFGEEIKIKNIMCPKCYEKFDEQKISLGDIKEVPREIFPDNEHTNEFTLHLDKSKADVTVGLLTSRDEQQIQEKVAQNRKHTNEEIELSILFGFAIKKINGKEEDFGTKMSFYDDLPISDARKIQHYLKRATGNVDLLLDWTCPSCGEITEQKLHFNEEFFFPDI